MRMLADAGTPKAFDALVDIAGKTRGQTRVNALDMLAQSRPSDPAVGAAPQRLAVLWPPRRGARTPATVLGRIGTEEARQTLIAALTGKDKDLAAAAAGALGQVGMTDSVKTALLGAAQANPQVKLQVMHQLINAGAPEGLRMAEEMLASKEPGAAQSAVWALASQGTTEAKRLIERALDSKDAQVRVAAITSLAQNPDEHSTDTLVRLARDSDPQVRAMALSTLGQVGSDAGTAGHHRRDPQRQSRRSDRRDLWPRQHGRSAREPAARLADARPRSLGRPGRDLLLVQWRPGGRPNPHPDRQRSLRHRRPEILSCQPAPHPRRRPRRRHRASASPSSPAPRATTAATATAAATTAAASTSNRGARSYAGR